jgi:hypothetical protein
VRAIDIDSDLRDPGGVTAQQLVDHIRALPGLDGAIRYIIYNRVIYHERVGFAPAPYTGASAHTEHIHFSGAFSQAGDESNFDYQLGELGTVILGTDDIQAIASKIGLDWNTSTSGIAKGARAQVAAAVQPLLDALTLSLTDAQITALAAQVVTGLANAGVAAGATVDEIGELLETIKIGVTLPA